MNTIYAMSRASSSSATPLHSYYYYAISYYYFHIHAGYIGWLLHYYLYIRHYLTFSEELHIDADITPLLLHTLLRCHYISYLLYDAIRWYLYERALAIATSIIVVYATIGIRIFSSSGFSHTHTYYHVTYAVHGFLPHYCKYITPLFTYATHTYIHYWYIIYYAAITLYATSQHGCCYDAITYCYAISQLRWCHYFHCHWYILLMSAIAYILLLHTLYIITPHYCYTYATIIGYIHYAITPQDTLRRLIHIVTRGAWLAIITPVTMPALQRITLSIITHYYITLPLRHYYTPFTLMIALLLCRLYAAVTLILSHTLPLLPLLRCRTPLRHYCYCIKGQGISHWYTIATPAAAAIAAFADYADIGFLRWPGCRYIVDSSLPATKVAIMLTIHIYYATLLLDIADIYVIGDITPLPDIAACRHAITTLIIARRIGIYIPSFGSMPLIIVKSRWLDTPLDIVLLLRYIAIRAVHSIQHSEMKVSWLQRCCRR